MTHLPISWNDIWYRLIVLRRLTLVCTVIVALAAWGAAALNGMHDTSGVLISLGVCIALLITHNLLFPAGWIDALALAFAMAFCHLTYPTLLADGIPKSNAVGMAYFLIPVIGFFAVRAAICGSFGWFPLGQIKRHDTSTLPLPADAVRAHEFVRPGMKQGLRRIGYADEKGLIPVWFDAIFPDADNGFEVPDPATRDDRPADYHVRILEQSDTQQRVQTIMPERTRKGALQSLVSDTSIVPTGPESCRYEVREVHNTWNLHVLVHSWLCDFDRDFVQALIDEVRGTPSRSLRNLPQVTMLSLIARFLARSGLADPG